MDDRIIVLDEFTSSKIAAGEIVERPMSVMKELIENSVDAQSKHITVEVGNLGRVPGVDSPSVNRSKDGIESIRVTDDGFGIREEDVELAFEPHATSKISKIEDLENLMTLGFRGEALPSIAAVSKVDMRTRHVDDEFGTHIRVEGGRIIFKREISHPVGTVVQVEDLFYNTPVRRKQLKTVSTELRHVVDVFTRYALILPGLHFKLFRDGQLLLDTPASGNLFDNIVGLYGKEIGRELMDVHYQTDDICITGYICKPSVVRKTNKMIHTYVNCRFVRNETIEKAIADAFHRVIFRNYFPITFLSIDIAPTEVNINIHPTKLYLDFYDEKKVYDAVTSSVRDTLMRKELIPTFQIQKKEEEKKKKMLQRSTTVESVQDSFDDLLSARTFPLYQLHDSYIIAQGSGKDIIIIDQHAAHERVNFERLLSSNRKIEKQMLLRPYIPELTRSRFITLHEKEDVLEGMGFELERFGEGGYVIRGVPSILADIVKEEEIMVVINEILEDDLDRFTEGESTVGARPKNELDERREFMISVAACRMSIKANQKLSYDEMKKLVEDLKNTKMPYTCPHGRPTMIKLSEEELEKKFRRR
jgi:DNA mismatch repair protein MutL